MNRVRCCLLALCFGIALIGQSIGAQASATAILDRIDVNGRRPIDFHAVVLPDTVYVGQQVTYQVAVMLSADARSRLRRNPEFLPPELHGLLAYELGTPTRVPSRNYSGGVFEAHVFQRALFPVTSGPQMVPAPQLTYALPQSSSYFSREERYVVRAESAAFIVKALPIEGRPDDFNGAVGVFKSSVKIDTTSARVGDPLVLTLRVQGTGNVKLLPRPTIELDWASAVPGTERIGVDSSGALVRGTKEFDWILTPARDGRAIVPPLRYVYFDPYLARYAVAESKSIELSVREGALATAEEGESAALMPLRVASKSPRELRTWNGRGVPPSDWLVWLVVALLAPLPVLWWSRGGLIPARRTASARARVTSSGAVARSDDQGERAEARAARRSFLESLSTRFGQSPQALVSRRHVARVLRRAGVTRETTSAVLVLLEQLDEMGFAMDDASASSRDSASTQAAARQANELLRQVESEALPRGRQISVPASILGCACFAVALGLMGFGEIRAQGNASTPRTVTMPADGLVDGSATESQAREAYERRAFTEAALRYRALADRSPHNPDVLTNWGTAAWAAGDTVDAVIAWQRAARLEPLAVDLQQRISELPAGARGGIADIPMVPVAWLLRGALLAWLVGWALWAWDTWRRRQNASTTSRMSRSLRAAARVTVLLSIVAGGAAWWGARALDASALAVVLRPETMRIAPGVDADAMGGVTTGDVVRVMESRDAWQRVVHADGRRGWLPEARLESLIELDTAATAPGTSSLDAPSR